MFNRILVAIDGSSYSQEALPATVEIAKRFDSEVLVLHASEHDRGRAVVLLARDAGRGDRDGRRRRQETAGRGLDRQGAAR